MKNYLNFETDIKNLESKIEKLKDPYNQDGLSEVDTKKISVSQQEIDEKLIKKVITFDVYEGENIPKDKKSVAINITLQAFDKTLTENDLDQISKNIIRVVSEKTGATIRS